MNVSVLIQLARGILDDSQDDAATLTEGIATYVDAFSRWTSETDGQVPELDRQSLEELADLHAKVISIAEDLKSDAARQLRDFGIKKRGMKAYVDPLPQRISVRRPKKG